MRDLVLVLVLAGGPGLTFRWPSVGILQWVWVTYM